MSNSPKVKADPLANFESVNLYEAEEIVWENMQIGWTSNVISSPGLGKSAMIYQIAEREELLVIDLRLSSMVPEDANGLPNFFEKDGKMRAQYVPMDFWPLEGDTMPENPKTGRPYKGFLVFLDEYNSGSLALQAASYKIILDKMIGQYKLHADAYVVAAGNLMSDRAITNQLGTATQSRLWHVPVRVCNETWHFWADANNVDQRVKAFLKFKPELLHSFDPNHDDLTFPCPRTWDGVSKRCLLWGGDALEPERKRSIAGVIGVGAAKEFVNFTNVYRSLLTIPQIIQNPTGVAVPNEPSVQHALTSMVGHALNGTNSAPLLDFLTRLPIDFQVVALRQAIGRDRTLMKDQHVSTWLKYNRDEVVRRTRN
jgi:hypothetical protein